MAEEKLNIAIISSDSVKSIDAFDKIKKNINNQKIDLIIGTQIISKGYNFKNL